MRFITVVSSFAVLSYGASSEALIPGESSELASTTGVTAEEVVVSTPGETEAATIAIVSSEPTPSDDPIPGEVLQVASEEMDSVVDAPGEERVAEVQTEDALSEEIEAITALIPKIGKLAEAINMSFNTTALEGDDLPSAYRLLAVSQNVTGYTPEHVDEEGAEAPGSAAETAAILLGSMLAAPIAGQYLSSAASAAIGKLDATAFGGVVASAGPIMAAHALLNLLNDFKGDAKRAYAFVANKPELVSAGDTRRSLRGVPTSALFASSLAGVLAQPYLASAASAGYSAITNWIR